MKSVPNQALQRAAATVDGLPGREFATVAAAIYIGRLTLGETYEMKMSRILRHCGFLTVLVVSVSGCVTVQNRYSVFGLDRFQTESLAQAKTWSLVLIGSVSLISMCVGACGFYLVQRLWRWSRHESDQPSQGLLLPKDLRPSTEDFMECSSNSVRQGG